MKRLDYGAQSLTSVSVVTILLLDFMISFLLFITLLSLLPIKVLSRSTPIERERQTVICLLDDLLEATPTPQELTEAQSKMVSVCPWLPPRSNPPDHCSSSE